MLKGFNSDVIIDGRSVHIQTEDWGSENPFLVSRVFYRGAVIKSIKTPYTSVLKNIRFIEPEDIQKAMSEQHHKILDLLLSGQF